ncbi:TniQ family protein [Stenotrophobium rhamnosiphilum]|uniref:TniQ domain-containing protein n=1 Tax=Stenotrophobium rhamnosiphilum TaxID=2029166 RepID=A0A2T5MCL5_9GAMM|nr:TniQ family protein [Stenotrophobium rhamnosiphilum]PTU30297.1 hypothetical protein CJD38_15235 [Stenotrophobium rhamnosiphilum]
MILTIPKPQPTEHATSILARLLRLNGLKDLRHLPDFDFEMKSTRGVALARLLGLSPQDFVRQHTIIPFRCAVHLPREQQPSSAAHREFSDDLSNLFSIRPRPPFYCSRCRQEDLEWHGFSFWRTTHQIPGVTRCQKHEFPLTAADVDPMLVLPEEIRLSRIKYQSIDLAAEAGYSRETEYVELAVDLLDLKRPILHSVLISRLQSRAKNFGFTLNSTRGFKHLEINRHFDQFARDRLYSPRRKSIMYPGVYCRYFWRPENLSKSMLNALLGTHYGIVATCLLALALSENGDEAAKLFRAPSPETTLINSCESLSSNSDNALSRIRQRVEQ